MKRKNPKTSKFTKSNKMLLVILVAVLALFGVLAFWRLDVMNTKASREDFENAQASIDKVYANIVAKLGQPANYKKSQSCSRPSQKFSQGPLSCDVGVDFLYQVNDEVAANTKYEALRNIVINNQDFDLLNDATKLETALVGNTLMTSALIDFKEKKSSLECYFGVKYDTPSETPEEWKSASGEKTFYSYIDCSGFARGEFFRLTH